jgi:UDP-N-acetylglucosamine--N-acetylmuramyl-(pentapeptide) pyrophosphoryl-undecaprenol N-acetylglucosamine transferase
MLAAGGTGGHLFPALALAQELKRRGIAVDLMTDRRGDRYGADFPARHVYAIPSATLREPTLFSAARTAATLARGILTAYRILGKARPSAVIGFGGYPSFPPLIAAALRRIPTALHEQNAVLGRANRLLARRVSILATSFDRVRYVDGALAAACRLTGNPVRDAVIQYAGRPYVPPAPGGRFGLVAFGGSQGARFLSDVVPAAVALLPEEMRRRLAIVQQCREEDLSRVEESYARTGAEAELATFFSDLPERLSRAHLVIARAGASTIAELTVLGRPSILVPLPHALDNDQLENARRLAAAGGAWCIEQRELTPVRLARELERLMGAPQELGRAAEAARSQGRPDAVARLADVVEELMRRSPQASRGGEGS